jgi:outer membrane protein OmpA-like peptidoglycan-associated protein
LLLGAAVVIAAFLFKSCGTSAPKVAAPAVEPPKIEAPKVEAPPVEVKPAEVTKVEAPVVPPAPVASAKPVGLNVEFDTASANIRTISNKNLDAFAKFIKDSSAKGEIGGHTDNQGKPESNLKLSQDRATAVVKYLESKGVAKGSLSAKGYGDTKPRADNGSDAGRQENRRVEFVAN